MDESLILVDEFGNRNGTAERSACHLGQGIKHRAFVTFLQDANGRLLIQKRHRSKLGGGNWDVSATSHVRSNETYAAAIRRCLLHELGVDKPITPNYLLSYSYLDRLGDRSENEYCSLFILGFTGTISPNPDELEDYRWLSVAELADWFQSDDRLFTRWFGEAFARLLRLQPLDPSGG